MKKVVRLTESDLIRLVKRVIKEQEVSEDNFIDDLMNNNSLISRGVKGLFGQSEKDEMKKDEMPYTLTKEIKNDSIDYLNSLSFDKVEKYGRIFYYENGEKSPIIIFDPTDQFACHVYTKPKLAQELAKKYDLILPKDLSENIRYIGSYDAGYRLVGFWVKNTEDSKCKGIIPRALLSSEEKILSSPKGNTKRAVNFGNSGQLAKRPIPN
jgi:hypothetical protein